MLHDFALISCSLCLLFINTHIRQTLLLSFIHLCHIYVLSLKYPFVNVKYCLSYLVNCFVCQHLFLKLKNCCKR